MADEKKEKVVNPQFQTSMPLSLNSGCVQTTSLIATRRAHRYYTKKSSPPKEKHKNSGYTTFANRNQGSPPSAA